MSTYTNIRKPAVAGQFYPDDPEKLATQIDHYLEQAPSSPLSASVQGVIAPHAGYSFSGPTAGKAYAACRDIHQIDKVAVLSPSHRVPFEGISVGDFDAFRTPFGDMPVATDTCRHLEQASDMISTKQEPHLFEHALEVQLPFIQHIFPEATLIPLICGEIQKEQIRPLAESIRPMLSDRQTLLIASSDFTHYGMSFGYVPFRENVPQRLKELDMGAVDPIKAIDPDSFITYLTDTGATICGYVPIALLLGLLEPAQETIRAELIEYTTSGALTGEYSHCVSYVSLVFTGAASDKESAATAAENTIKLEEDDKRYLLGLARETIQASVVGEQPSIPDATNVAEHLRQDCATFVTLRKQGQLRGCIGSLEATEPLYRNVISNAVNSAFHDPRFPALSNTELAELNIEISVLTPSRRIRGVEEFHAGKHGIILKKGGNRAVFLPQVATEQGWDRETTLNHLSLKAGLPQNAWRHGNTEFEVFEAIVFSENDVDTS